MITSGAKQSHIDSDLYNLADENKRELKEIVENKQRSFNSMVHATFLSQAGKELKEHLKEELARPVYLPGSTQEQMLIREGARQLILNLLKADEMGGEQNKPKSK